MSPLLNSLCKAPRERVLALVSSLVAVLAFGLVSVASAQTNPTAQSLPYTQNFSSLNPATGTALPAGWQGWTIGSGGVGSYRTTAATADRAMTASGTAGSTTGTIYNYLDKPGYLNSNAIDVSIAVALNTTGQRGIKIGYDIMTIRNPYDGSTNTRISLTTLQYRVGTTGAFTTLAGLDYANNTTAQTTGTTGQKTESKSVVLPAACDNQSVVQLRWVSRDSTGGGSRPSIAIDNFSAAGSIDGTIAVGEYGTHADGANQQSSSTGTWYTRSDTTFLYVGVASTNTTEAAVLYLDKNPLTTVNGGTNTNGNLTGFSTYDGSSFAALPFRADLVVYFKSGYREYRTADGAGGWSAATSGFGTYAESGSGAGNAREIAIPWSAIGGRPSAYNWFGYVAYAGGGAYASVPTENPGSGGGVTIGSAARWSRYYTVSTSSQTPFSRNSYCFTDASSVSSFGSISVYDFTMNSSGNSITRGTGKWSIANALRVDAGTIDFGAVADSANVSGGVSIASGATLKLSSSLGGDLNLYGGNWSNSGSFTPNARAVFFSGSSAQTLTGATTFDYLYNNNASGLTLANDMTVNSELGLGTSRVTTGANKLILGNAATTSRSTGYVVGNLEMGVPTGSAVSRTFHLGDATNYTPMAISFGNVSTSGTLLGTVAGAAGAPPAGSGLSTTKYVDRKWALTNSGIGFNNYSGTFNFVAGDLKGSASTAALAVAKNTGGTWSRPTVGTRTATSTQATGLTAFSDYHVGELLSYTITASAGTGGSISPVGAQAVNYGDSLAFTITPATGYSIADVLVDGVSVGAVSSYTFTNVTANHTIDVQFLVNPPVSAIANLT
ncbi:MAG: hypothetical protein ACKON8_09975, partial [Planctomycetota bacterium]